MVEKTLTKVLTRALRTLRALRVLSHRRSFSQGVDLDLKSLGEGQVR